ncbi:MAG TPA: LamG-like jellyroll fold domain-containing protein, partial [Thermomicrobiales bacterium]|nr:LamG-like jellyroll fold domain-containing protein [Thermomicrobiales bacterium]
FVVFVYGSAGESCDMVDRWTQANAGIGAYLVLKVFSGYTRCANQPDGWHQYVPASATDHQPGKSYVISPGFWKWGEASPRLERDPNRWAQNIQSMIASNEPFQLVTTFNEWGEGSSAESATEWESSSGYGVYLDALHADGQISFPTPTPVATDTPTPEPTATPTNTPTPTPTPPVWVPFTDGFETGDLSAWTSYTGMVVQSAEVRSGSFAARATSNGGEASATKVLALPEGDLYARTLIKPISLGANQVTVISVGDGTGHTLLTLYIGSTGKLSTHNLVDDSTAQSDIVVATGMWHDVELHVSIGAGIEVWFDGQRVDTLSGSAALGTAPIGQIRIGEPTAGRTFDVAFDDVSVDTAFITPVINATPTPEPTATDTPSPEPTETPTPQPTATDTPAPEPTATDTPAPEPTATDTPEPVPTDTPTPEPLPTDTPVVEPTPTPA